MLDVSCAIIIDESGRVLVAQRSESMPMPLKWEFPGGKVEPGETAEACLVREIREELDIRIRVVDRLEANVHSYGSRTIRLIPFTCRIISGTIRLREHRAFLWLQPAELPGLDWSEADIPCVQNFLARL